MTLPFQFAWPIELLGWVGWLIVLPGYLIAFFLWEERVDAYARIGTAFALGFTLFAFQSLLGYLMEWSLEALFWLSSSITMTLILIYWLRRYKRIPAVSDRYSSKGICWQTGAVLLVVALLGAYISLGSGWHPRGDAAIHLQAIRKMIDQPSLTQPIYSLNTKTILWDHAYDAYYPLVAMITYHSGLELTVVWHYLSGVMALLLPFVIYTLLRALHANRLLIFNSLLFFLFIGIFYPTLMFGTVFDALVYPNRVYLWLLLPISLALFFRYLNDKGKIYVVISALIAALQILIHQNGFLFYYWILGGVFLLGLILPKRRVILMRTSATLVLTTIFALPLLWLKWPYNQEFVHLATLPIWHHHYHFWHLSDQVYAFNPRTSLNIGMLIGFAITAVAVYRARQSNNVTLPMTELFLGACFIHPPLIVYNPVAMPIVASILSYPSVGRMLRIPPYYLAYAYGMGMLLNIFKNLFLRDRVFNLLKVSSYICVCSVFLLLAKPGFSVLKKLNFDHQLPHIIKVVSHLHPGSLVLAGVLTSTDIVTFADVYTLVMQFNGPIDLVDISAGRKVVNQVLVQEQSLEMLLKILIENKIDYILIDMNSIPPKDILKTNPDLFELVYYDQRYLVYKLDNSALKL